MTEEELRKLRNLGAWLNGADIAELFKEIDRLRAVLADINTKASIQSSGFGRWVSEQCEETLGITRDES